MEMAARRKGSNAYGLGVAIAVVTCFLTVWTTIVRDDGNGAGFFMVILAAAVGAFAAGFRAAGMARAMLGVAVMQVLLGGLIATAPPSEWTLRVVIGSAVFVALWLASAAAFWKAARARQADQ
jgi:hypothetical protein